jgi:hypothetical protein
MDERDDWALRRQLGAGDERPRSRGAAKKGDELASFHSAPCRQRGRGQALGIAHLSLRQAGISTRPMSAQRQPRRFCDCRAAAALPSTAAVILHFREQCDVPL